MSPLQSALHFPRKIWLLQPFAQSLESFKDTVKSAVYETFGQPLADRQRTIDEHPRHNSRVEVASRTTILLRGREKDKHFPGKAIDTVSEFLEREGVKDLKLKAANTTEIKLDGVVVVQFSLKEGEEGIAVPMLVASEEISQPILGYNVIEELILSGSLEHRVALRVRCRLKAVGNDEEQTVYF